MPQNATREPDETASAAPDANLGMVRAGIAALEEARRTGAAFKENGDANVVYAIYTAMQRAFAEQRSRADNEVVDAGGGDVDILQNAVEFRECDALHGDLKPAACARA